MCVGETGFGKTVSLCQIILGGRNTHRVRGGGRACGPNLQQLYFFLSLLEAVGDFSGLTPWSSVYEPVE
jgi:hypothetical protein